MQPSACEQVGFMAEDAFEGSTRLLAGGNWAGMKSREVIIQPSIRLREEIFINFGGSVQSSFEIVIRNEDGNRL